MSAACNACYLNATKPAWVAQTVTRGRQDQPCPTHSTPTIEAQPEIDFNGTTFTVTETVYGKRLDINEFDYYQEIFEDEIPALISFLTEHFGDTK